MRNEEVPAAVDGPELRIGWYSPKQIQQIQNRQLTTLMRLHPLEFLSFQKTDGVSVTIGVRKTGRARQAQCVVEE